MKIPRRQWGWICHLPISPDWPLELAREECGRRFWTRNGAQRDLDQFVDMFRKNGPHILARLRFEVAKLGPIENPYSDKNWRGHDA